MKWYYCWIGMNIEPPSEIEVKGHTRAYVILPDGAKRKKRTESEGYFETEQQAWDFIADALVARITRALSNLESAHKLLERKRNEAVELCAKHELLPTWKQLKSRIPHL